MSERLCARWMRDNQLVRLGNGVTGRVYGYVTHPYYPELDEVLVWPIKPGRLLPGRDAVCRSRELGLKPPAPAEPAAPEHESDDGGND